MCNTFQLLLSAYGAESPTWWTLWVISRSSLCSTTCVTGHHCIHYPVCRMMHIEDILLLIAKSNQWSDGSRFPLSLSEWSLTRCLMSYNCKYKCVECVLLNKNICFLLLIILGDKQTSNVLKVKSPVYFNYGFPRLA